MDVDNEQLIISNEEKQKLKIEVVQLQREVRALKKLRDEDAEKLYELGIASHEDLTALHTKFVDIEYQADEITQAKSRNDDIINTYREQADRQINLIMKLSEYVVDRY